MKKHLKFLINYYQNTKIIPMSFMQNQVVWQQLEKYPQSLELLKNAVQKVRKPYVNGQKKKKFLKDLKMMRDLEES